MQAGEPMQVTDRLPAMQNKTRSESKEGQVKAEGTTLRTLPSSQPEIERV